MLVKDPLLRPVFLLVLVLPIISISGICQDDFNTKIYKSFIQGNISTWDRIIENTPEPLSTAEELYEYTLALQGYIGYCVKVEKKEKGIEYLDKAMRLSNRLLRMQPADPRVHALRGAFWGLHMGLGKGVAPVVGTKALKNINNALELDPQSPQALMEMGNKDWNAPKLMGGSKKNAIRGYEKAIRLMENSKTFVKDNWYYLNAHIILATAYEELEMTVQLKQICKKLIRIEPDLVWPKRKLDLIGE